MHFPRPQETPTNPNETVICILCAIMFLCACRLPSFAPPARGSGTGRYADLTVKLPPDDSSVQTTPDYNLVQCTDTTQSRLTQAALHFFVFVFFDDVVLVLLLV